MRLVYGSRDIIDLLEDTLEKARTGEVLGVVVSLIDKDDGQWTDIAWVEDTPYPWSRLHAAAASSVNHLMQRGLDEDPDA